MAVAIEPITIKGIALSQTPTSAQYEG